MDNEMAWYDYGPQQQIVVPEGEEFIREGGFCWYVANTEVDAWFDGERYYWLDDELGRCSIALEQLEH